MESQQDRTARIVQVHREYYQSGQTRIWQFRRTQLRLLLKAIGRYEAELCEALWRDLHKSREEAFLTEIALVKAETKGLIRHLKHWSATRRAATPLFMFGSCSRIRQEPYGVVAILSPWNYPFQLLFAPLAGALAAGNCAVLKPSPRTPAVNEVMRKLISEVFAPEYVSFLEGGAETARALLQQRLDYIFFTGSPALGREAMTAAAARLIPLTLELGGKSPCVVDRTADVKIAARRIAWGKFLNAGQTCVAPDYLLVHREIVPELTAEIKLSVSRMFGADLRQSPYYGRLIGNEEVERMRRLMESGEVVFGGETDAAARYVAPTLLRDVVPDSPLMQQEIFGPLLPVLEFDDLEAEVVPFISEREKPLALYYFGERRTGEALFGRVDSGGGCVNDVVLHLANPALPFGGAGGSGMGQYHGRYSFETFSRPRSVLTAPRKSDFAMKYPPYNGFRMIRKLF